MGSFKYYLISHHKVYKSYIERGTSMPNAHQIVDSDPKFSIDPVTRTISNSSRKTRLIQYDHNSEKISFIMPRMVEGHDMTLCNNVRIQYINLDDKTQHKKSVGVYSVDDITQNEEDDTISFSWLISRNATKYIGTLNFLIQFECILDDGTVEYSWHTDAFKGITVSEGMDVEDTIVHYYPDIFEQWKNEVIQMTANTLSQYATTAYVDTSISELGNIVTEEKLSEDLSHKINSVNNVIPDENGNVEIDAVLYSSQRLSSEQQEIARTNIDAVSTDSLEEISPDDNIVDGKPWTSRKIVDTLCPPFDVSGSAVTCHPLERYPLDVKVSWEPVQDGEGDPSPDNIRPIKGRDVVKVERCGENLLNIKPFNKFTKNGITFEYVLDGGIHMSGTSTAIVDGPVFPFWHLPPGKYYGLNGVNEVSASFVVQRNGKPWWITAKGIFEILAGDVAKYWYIAVKADITIDETIYPYIVPGTTAPHRL